MPPALKRKMGPLALYQWILLGIVLGGGLYFYNRGRKPPATSSQALTPDTAQAGVWGPTDPNTGIPYAFEAASGSQAPTSGATSAQQEIGDVTGLVDALGPLLNPETPLQQLGDLATFLGDLRDTGILGVGGGAATSGMSAAEKAQLAKLKKQQRQEARRIRKLEGQLHKKGGRSGAGHHPGQGGKAGSGGHKQQYQPGQHPAPAAAAGGHKRATSTGAGAHAAAQHHPAPHPAARARPAAPRRRH